MKTAKIADPVVMWVPTAPPTVEQSQRRTQLGRLAQETGLDERGYVAERVNLQEAGCHSRTRSFAGTVYLVRYGHEKALPVLRGVRLLITYGVSSR